MYRQTTPQTKRRRFVLRGCMAALLAALLLLGWRWAGSIRADLAQKGAEALRATVQQRAVQCYAVEGAYPESLGYLEQNYGLRINRERYIVTYEIFAPNLLPDVAVLVRS